MKKLKTLCLIILAMASAAVTFQSCDNDDNPNICTYPGGGSGQAIVTVKPNADNSAVTLQLNDSATLMPKNMTKSPWGAKEKRAYLYFSFNEAKPNSNGQLEVIVHKIDSILTKGMNADLGEGNDKAYGKDPVEIVKSWETNAEDGYLTLRFRTNFGMADVTHKVTLIPVKHENGEYEVEFRHDANGDTGGTLADGIVAFRLDDAYNQPDKPYDLKIRWKSFSGDKSTTFKYIPRKK